MSFETPRRGSSARGSMDGRPRSLRPTSGRAGAAAPSAYAGVGVRAVATGPSHLTQREFQFSFDAIASARDRASARGGTRPPAASATTSSLRASSARRGDFAGARTFSAATPVSRSLRDDGSIGSTREATTHRGTRQSTAGTTAGRTASAERAASARPSSRLLDRSAASTPTRVGFGTHDPSSRVGAAAGAARATRDATTKPSSFSERRRVDPRFVAERPVTAAAPSRYRVPARGDAAFSPTMSTEGAIEAAYRRARGEFADAEDMVAEEVEARRALAPPAANTTSVSRAVATARLHKGVPVSPGVSTGDVLKSVGGVHSARPATAASTRAAAAKGFASSSLRARAGTVAVPLPSPGSPAVALARSAAVAARSLATDPARAHDDLPDERVAFDRGPVGEPDRTATSLHETRLERVAERVQPRSDPAPADRRPRPVSGAPRSGAGMIADAMASTRPAPEAPPFLPAPSPQQPSKAVSWAPSPSPARPRRAASAAPGGRAPGPTPAAAAARTHDASAGGTAPLSAADLDAGTSASASFRDEPLKSATPLKSPLTERNGVARALGSSAPGPRAGPRAWPVMRLADVDDSGSLPGYVLGEVVGEGGFCKVRLGIHQVSGAKTAVKLIDKSKLSSETDRKRVGREIRVLKRLTHPNVVRLFDVVETASRIFCVMEFADGGSVLDHVRARRHLDENTAASFTAQIADALDYCHRNWIAHRDVKLENLLLDKNKRRVMLVDFGLSAVFQPGKKLTVHCGSPSYAAPEIVSRKPYDGPPVDVWSMGVVAFAMVAGYLPFHAKNSDKRELCRKIVRGTYTAPESASDDFKEFAGIVLRVDPERRATLARCRDARWIRNARTEKNQTGFSPSRTPSERGVDSDARLPSSRVSRVSRDPRASPTAFPAAPSGAAVDQARVDALVAAGMDRADLTRYLEEGEHNYHTAAYHLLAYRDAVGAGDAGEAARSAGGTVPKPFRAVSSARGGGATRDAAANASKRIGAARPSTAMERRREAATAAETPRRLNVY